MNRSLVLLSLASSLFVACSSAPPPSEDAVKEEQGWTVVPIVPPLEVYDDPCPDGSPGCTCPRVNTTCTAVPHVMVSGAQGNAWMDGLLARNCNPNGYKYQYRAGGTITTPQQFVHQCPDSPSLRAYVAAHADEHIHPYIGSDVCDRCLAALPAGKVYVFWNTFVKPNCPSGCRYPFPPGS